MLKKIVFFFLSIAIFHGYSFAFSSAEIKGDNRADGPKWKVKDTTVEDGLDAWRARIRRKALERQRRIDEHNRAIRELRRWLDERKPVHDTLRAEILEYQRQADEVKLLNTVRHSQLQTKIKEGREEISHIEKDIKSVQDDLDEKLRSYDTLRNSIAWGSGEGSDQGRFDKSRSEFNPHRDYDFATDMSSPPGQNIAEALAYRNLVAEQMDPSEDGFGKKAFVISTADKALNIADQSYSSGEVAEGDFAIQAAESLLDLALGLTPGVSWGKDMYEAITGRNLVSGHDIDTFERSMAILGAATVGVGSAIGKAAKALNVFKKLEEVGGVLKTRGFRKSVEEAQSLLQAAPHIENSAGVLRNSPGKAVISRPLHDTAQMMRGSHGNAGLVPEIIGKRLEGKEFRKFDEFKEAFWMEVADSKYAAEFSPANRALMAKGYSPKPVDSQWIGSLKDKDGRKVFSGRSAYELHHIHPINQGGSVYDASNIMIATPRFHDEVLIRKYHYGR